MSTSPTQLDEIYIQVRKFFSSHPVIAVSPMKGTPPDQYEITYSLNGMCKTGEGKIVETGDHKVELAIPFGFPHFPPSCKPKSNIFHPDFDPAAICLSDYWEQDRSLPDLIVHLGQMINGEFYSTTNTFNEEAAKWYLDNKGKFPLAHINWAGEQDSQPSSPDRPHEIDTLDDTDLSTEFDFLALEKGDEDIILDTAFPEVDSTNAVDFDFLNLLVRQNKYYTLLENIKAISPPSDELTSFVQHGQEEVRKAEKLHREAKKAENKGDARIALRKYQQIEAAVADFPTIDSDIHRIKQTLALLNDLSPDSTPDFSKTDAEATAEEPEEKLAKPDRAISSKDQTKKKKAHAKEPIRQGISKPGKNVPIARFLLPGLLVLGLGYGGYFWHSMTEKLNDAQTTYDRCSSSQANNQFEAAKRSCDTALQLAGGIKFFHRDEAKRLETSILEILHSEKLVQGLAGKILINGKYLPKKEAAKLQSVHQKLIEAETFFKAEKWQQALELYSLLIKESQSNANVEPPVLEDMQRKKLFAEFRSNYDPAQLAIQNSRWEEAIENLLQAQKILVSLPEADREQYSKALQDALQKSQFANLKAQGDLSFTGSDWMSAIESYNLALANSQKAALPPESIEAIRNNIKRAEIYNTINKGNKAFASGSWDEAIGAYSRASKLLTGNNSKSGELDSNINVRKLTRIILQASIIRDQQKIDTLLEKDELVGVRHLYQKILGKIANSSFATEPEFTKTYGELSTALKAVDQKIYVQKKVAYLLDNYQSLFIANYPSANPENLTNPVVTSSKETESKLVFKMQCTELGGGRPLTLVMYYAYDKKTGKWALFSEN